MSVTDLIYGPLSPLYDLVCGAVLQPGRRRAMSLLAPNPGERILEIGVGSGFGVNDYPTSCRVVAVDLSRAMLERARRRVDGAHRDSVSFALMDAAQLALPDGAFDAVYVPYTLNVLPDPLAAGRELVRVCRPGGRVVFLNHFQDVRDTSNLVNRVAGSFAVAADVNWQLRLETLVPALDLRLLRIESVNVPRLSSVVVCEKKRGH